MDSYSVAVRPWGVVAVGHELEEVDDVDEADLQVGKVLAEKRGGGECFLRADVAARGHDDVRVGAFVRRRPLPDAEALGAVHDRVVHVEVLQVVLLVGDDDVDVVFRAEAVVHCAEEAVCVGREVDADDFGGLVGDDVEEARVLVGEAVVVLSPDGRGEEYVERRDLLSPRDFLALFQPLAVLVDHAVDDVDERFVAVKHAVTTGQEVSFQPACTYESVTIH